MKNAPLAFLLERCIKFFSWTKWPIYLFIRYLTLITYWWNCIQNGTTTIRHRNGKRQNFWIYFWVNNVYFSTFFVADPAVWLTQTNYVFPHWRFQMNFIKQIGDHLFLFVYRGGQFEGNNYFFKVENVNGNIRYS